VRGWTRRLWQGSPDHRGVPDAPGRVATLVRDEGAICGGVGYCIERDRERILAELDVREIAGFVRTILPLYDDDGTIFAEAIVWVADETNPHFLGHASDEAIAAHVKKSHGPSGANVDYVLRLRDALRALDIDDAHVEAVSRLIAT